MYRRGNGTLEVFLIHPGGPFWNRKDDGAWSIPKGEYDDEEEPLAAAKREFIEETGFAPGETCIELRPVKQAGGKTVRAWAFEGDCDAAQFVSNTFEIEWPPRSGKLRTFPEVDKAAWFGLAEARRKINVGQALLLDDLEAMLSQA